MNARGSVFKYPDNVDTDVIIPARHLNTQDAKELASHCMEDIDKDFAHKVRVGDVLVAGKNFGCGSSREQAPLALKYSGISAVLAKSFARIFYRNAINVGVPALICDTSCICDGDEISVDMDHGIVTINGNKELKCQAFSPVMQSILSAGGLTPFLREKGDFML